MRALLLIYLLRAACGQVRTPEAGRVRLDVTVVDALTNAPVAGATVTGSTFRSTTDAAGCFSAELQRMNDLRFVITKAGYVTAESGCRLQGRDNQGREHCAEVVLRLAPMGTVTGSILNAQGRPAAKASVELTSLSFGLGAGGETDEQGRFKIEAVPGSYVVCAKSQQEVEREFRTPDKAAPTSPVSRCYPSVGSPEDGVGVTLASGEIAGPITIRLSEERVFAIGGRLRTRVRKVESWSARIFAVPDAPSSHELEGQIDARTGVFRIPALRTGMYTVVAMAGPVTNCDTCEAMTFYATTRVKLERDVGDVTLTLRRTATVSGHLVISGKSTSTLEDQQVELDPRLPGGGLSYALKPATGADREGRFEFTNVVQGLYRLRAGTYPDYEIATVELNGRQLAPDSFLVRSTSVSGLTITLRPTDAFIKPDLSFTVKDWYSRDYRVIAIPEADLQDWGRWIDARIVSPTDVLGPLPSGVYLVLLIDSNNMGSVEGIVDEIRLHRREAVRVVLKNGTTERVTLRAIRVD